MRKSKIRKRGKEKELVTGQEDEFSPCCRTGPGKKNITRENIIKAH
jgi:hypothetical protein